VTGCVSEVAKWCATRRLQLNDDKTEMIWFGSRSNLAKLQRINLSLQHTAQQRRPGSGRPSIWTQELTMKEHVTKITAACFYHIRRLCQFVIGSARKSHSSWSWRSYCPGWTTVTACWQDCQRPRCSHYSASRMQLLDWC